jgi:hypothetical protein
LLLFEWGRSGSVGLPGNLGRAVIEAVTGSGPRGTCFLGTFGLVKGLPLGHGTTEADACGDEDRPRHEDHRIPADQRGKG